MKGWLRDIWASFRVLPGWVQIWVGLILVPVNALPVIWIGAPFGWIVALLSVGGMAPNLWFLIRDRAFGPVMSLSHLVLWPPLVLVVLWLLRQDNVTGSYRAILWVLLWVDVVSLAFDVFDARKWWRSRK